MSGSTWVLIGVGIFAFFVWRNHHKTSKTGNGAPNDLGTGDPNVKPAVLSLGPDISIVRVPTSTIDNTGKQVIAS